MSLSIEPPTTMEASLVMEESQEPTLESQLHDLATAKKPLVLRKYHPSLPLAVYNYTHCTQFRKLWTPITELARGLILERGTSTIVARPMTKFYNYEEGRHRADPNDTFTVLEKLDGSLGTWFCYKGQWIMATRGAFTSPQAQKGLEMATAKCLHAVCNPSKTYCFEIIYPDNRIIINYGDRSELILLAVIDTATGYDTPNKDLPQIAEQIRVPCAKSFHFPGKTLEELAVMNTADEEGFIIRYDTTGERVKVKFSTYNALHEIRGNPQDVQTKPKAKKMRKVAGIVRGWLLADPNYDIEQHFDIIPECFQDLARGVRRDFERQLEWRIDQAKQVLKREGLDAGMTEVEVEEARKAWAMEILRNDDAGLLAELSVQVYLAGREAKMQFEKERAKHKEAVMRVQWLELAGLPGRVPGEPI